MIPVVIKTEYIQLAAFLKFAGAVMSGGEAKLLIRGGEVLVNGEPCVQAGKKLRVADRISAGGETYEVVAECI